MKKEISIRAYHSSDVEALMKIFYNTVHKINCKDYTKKQLDVWAPLSCLKSVTWAEKFAKTNPIIATIDHQIVGFAEFLADGYIDCFYCHHEWIRKNVGSTLMQEILQRAKNAPIERVFSEVSITAKPFFEKWGFHVTSLQKIQKNGVELINFKMEREV
ncbi:MAG: GNAT family N-acetyltransferase [Chlamydiae bacterium]|nr:GNAT family N-acetyltransferase [Chlamydiota bacterium]